MTTGRVLLWQQQFLFLYEPPIKDLGFAFFVLSCLPVLCSILGPSMLISSSQVLTSRFLSRSSFPHHFRLLNHYLTTSGRAHAVHVCTRNMSSVLEDLKFDNRALKSLPIDRETENYVRSVAG